MAEKINDLAVRYVWIPTLAWLMCIGVVVYFVADREPPFRLLSVEPAFAKAGEYVTIRASVKRDLTRECSATFTRYIEAADGVRFNMGTNYVSAELIRMTEAKNPGILSLAVKVPESIAAGQAEVLTALEYRCNRAHVLWPIEVSTRLPFVVLAP